MLVKQSFRVAGQNGDWQGGGARPSWSFSLIFMRIAVIVIVIVVVVVVGCLRLMSVWRRGFVSPPLSPDPGWLSRLLGLSFCRGGGGLWHLRSLGRLQLCGGLLLLAERRNVCARLNFRDMIVDAVVVISLAIIVVITVVMRFRRSVLVVRMHMCLLVFVPFVMWVIMIVDMFVLHMSARMFMLTIYYLGVVVVMSCMCARSWTGSSGLLGALCGILLRVWMVGGRLVVWMSVPVAISGGCMRVMPFLHIHQVEVSHVVMAQLLVLSVYQLHFPKTQAEQQTLKSLEVELVLLAVAAE